MAENTRHWKTAVHEQGTRALAALPSEEKRITALNNHS